MAEPLHIEQDPAGEIARVPLTEEEMGTVIHFPLVREKGTPYEASEYDEPDQAPAAGIDRTKVDYIQSQNRVRGLIDQTRQDTENEVGRQMRMALRPNNPDEVAERKSDAAWTKVEGLQSPAGSSKHQKAGHDVLRIVQ